MLRLSKLADYGTQVMAVLARNPDSAANAREIAAETHLSIPTVSKLLKLLSHAKLLHSRRGIRGGYQLAHPPKAISVAAIIEALEGKSGLTECSNDHHHCALSSVCRTRGNWQILNHAIQRALESVSLEALARPHLKEYSIDVSAIQTVGTKPLENSI